MSGEPQQDADREGILAEIRRSIRTFMTDPGFSPDDPAWHSQVEEMWAIERLHQRREEVRREAEALQRAFVQGQICAYLTEGYSRAAAARAAGVRPETLSRWCRTAPAFAAAAKAAEEQRRHVQPAQRRRRKMTDSMQAAIVRLLQAGMTRTGAAAEAGISPTTFYTWFQRLPDFRDAVLGAEDAAAARRLPKSAR
ncbi:MAG: hypothetical protein ACYDB7_07755 [Mycobacteriales bacterium]